MHTSRLTRWKYYSFLCGFARVSKNEGDEMASAPLSAVAILAYPTATGQLGWK